MQDARRTLYMMVFSYWMLIFLLVYFVGWQQEARTSGQDSGVLLFFILGLASAVAGLFVMFRAIYRPTPLTLAEFRTKLLITLALLELPTLLGIFVVGPIRFEPMTQLLVSISAVGIPVAGFGGLGAFWRSQDA